MPCVQHPPAHIELSKLEHVTASRPLDAMWELSGGHRHSKLDAGIEDQAD
jgi:hypothetical protein